jgi:hypothetical protein
MDMDREALLYVSDQDSVRLCREHRSDGLIELHVYGPKDRRRTFTFNVPDTCDQYQAAFEATLRASGYVRLRTADRRAVPAVHRTVTVAVCADPSTPA